MKNKYRNREREMELRLKRSTRYGNRYRFQLFDPVRSVSIARFLHVFAPCVHTCGEMPSLSLSSRGAAAACSSVSCASLGGLFVCSRVTAACKREEAKKWPVAWKEADVPPRPLPVRISGQQLRLAANFRPIIAMREDDSPADPTIRPTTRANRSPRIPCVYK